VGLQLLTRICAYHEIDHVLNLAYICALGWTTDGRDIECGERDGSFLAVWAANGFLIDYQWGFSPGVLTTVQLWL